MWPSSLTRRVRSACRYLALGQQRAEAVRRSLAVLGVSEAQMEAVSYGKEKLASMGADETAHAANRRVELSR